MATSSFDFGDFLARLLGALVLVTASWNPSGYSYSRWLADHWPSPSPLIALAGLLLLIGWVIYLRSTFRALGALGVLLACAFAGVFMWLLIDYGLISADSSAAIAWIAIAALSLVMAIGMSWSHIRRRLTGQLDVDDVDED